MAIWKLQKLFQLVSVRSTAKQHQSLNNPKLVDSHGSTRMFYFFFKSREDLYHFLQGVAIENGAYGDYAQSMNLISKNPIKNVKIPKLLEDGINVLIYAREFDLICNWLGNKNYVLAKTLPFLVQSKVARLVTKYGPLIFMKIHDAGHMVPMDQPKASLQMLENWMDGGYMVNTGY